MNIGWTTKGFKNSIGFPDYISNGVLKSIAVEGLKFTKQHAVSKIFTHSDFGGLDCINIHLTFSIKILFILSTNPFCCGATFTVICLAIPSFAQKLSNG